MTEATRNQNSASRRLLGEIETYLEECDTTDTGFGRWACGDPNLVRDLREGRNVGRRLQDRIRGAMLGAPITS